MRLFKTIFDVFSDMIFSCCISKMKCFAGVVVELNETIQNYF